MHLRRRRPTRAPLRRAAGLSAVIGLFVMHGLALCGPAHLAVCAVAEPMSVAGVMVAADPDLHHPAHGAGAAHATDQAVAHVQGAAPAGLPLGLAGMCLAVLLLGVALLVLARHRASPWVLRRSSRTSPSRPGRARGDRDPPCRYVLSVQRC